MSSLLDRVRGHNRASSDSTQFIEATKRDAQNLLQKELDRLLKSSEPDRSEETKQQYEGFTKLFTRFLDESGPSVDWDKIEKLPNDAVRDYSTLETPTAELVHKMLDKLVVVKLNGGLGTSMGCHGPKSVITVRSDLTFLDLTVQQIENLNKTYKVNVPLVLMNSFNTDEDTEKIIRKYKNLQVDIHTFNQSCYPRINRDSLMPIAKNGNIHNNLDAWYPPGHGDFYESFKNSGLLKKFLDGGREYCYISNIDNLGATVDLNILNLLLNPNQGDTKHEFVMEVTDKTRADVKGGTLIQYEGKLRLLEIAQVPKEHVDEFKSVKTFKFFNTNNLWAKLDAIERVLKEDLLNLEIIINNKTLANGQNVIQLETAVGAAMKTFEGGIGINVPRSRFLPVKKTSDLFLVMSNLYSLKYGSLRMSPQRMFPTTPLVKLGDNHFSKVKEFLGRFANIPDIIELDHLTVSGDVTFGRGVSLRVRGHNRASSDSIQLNEATKRDAQNLLQKELDRLLKSCEPDRFKETKQQYEGFTKLFTRFLDETGPSVDWDKIEKLPNEAVRDYSTLETPAAELVHKMLDKLVVVELNGGLGTSMGCDGPKSMIKVRDDLTFLDLTIQQIENLNKTYKVNVPLVLMNSFNTDEDTQKIIQKYKNVQVEIHTFNQSCYPRINRDSWMPIAKNGNIHNNLDAWYPPGHGDFYESFKNSGLLKKFLDAGREYCYISNIDNLGATVDLNILNLLLNPNLEYTKHELVMEVTDKTRADVKGGTLIQYEGKLRLLEISQVPKEHVNDFESVKTFKFFNTNNLWAKLDAIERILKEDLLNLELIINNKTLANGQNIIQLETALGAAMKTFEGGIGINVPRSRFLPVKKTSDLFLVMSNLYSLEYGSLRMSPQRMFPTTPLVKLGDNHFSKVKEFLGRFANIPDILDLDHLTVSGDVTFGKGVSLRGTVIIIANHGDRIDIPSGAILENKIVSGNMRILNH